MHRMIALAGLLLAAAGCVARPPEDPMVAFQRSIAAASTVSPGFAVPLRRVPPDAAMVEVAHLDTGRPAATLAYPIWVSLPDELRGFCRGKPDPLLAIQQALGLPPGADARQRLYLMRAPRSVMFRPCPGGGDVGAESCTAERISFTARPGRVTPRYGISPAQDADTTRFLLEQLWNSHRAGFAATGAPFTGMGWAYNWDPQAASPVGATEFVLRAGATLDGIREQTPAEFCAQ